MRRVSVRVLGLVVVIAMATALWRYVAVGDPQGELLLSDVAGQVQVERPGAGEVAAESGTVLQAEDRVSTGDASRAVLTMGRDTHVRLGPTSSVQVVSIDEAGVSLELEDGALQATVRPESGGVRVGSRGRAVLATNAEFEMGVSDDVLQISAGRGTLSLSGLDQTRLEEGQQATVIDRHAEVGPVSEELLLAVDWPGDRRRTRKAVTTVTGRTAPGARVMLRGSFGERSVRADATGVFRAEVPLAEGDNSLEVLAVDALGHHTEVVGALQTRDTKGPSFRGGVEYER